MRYIAFLAALLPLPAFAQSANCASPEVVAERLLQGYGERRISIALGASNTLVETWANLSSGSWTITVTQPGGLTCLVASGEAFALIVEPQGVDG